MGGAQLAMNDRGRRVEPHCFSTDDKVSSSGPTGHRWDGASRLLEHNTLGMGAEQRQGRYSREAASAGGELGLRRDSGKEGVD